MIFIYIILDSSLHDVDSIRNSSSLLIKLLNAYE